MRAEKPRQDFLAGQSSKAKIPQSVAEKSRLTSPEGANECKEATVWRKSREVRRVAIFISIIALTTIGCASRDEWRTSLEPADAGKNARAHPAAYGISDGFTFGKPHRVRPANDFQFYYKECGLTDPIGDRAYFSKTAYACTGPR